MSQRLFILVTDVGDGDRLTVVGLAHIRTITQGANGRAHIDLGEHGIACKESFEEVVGALGVDRRSGP